ncbi:MAG: A/G-specific adenine glycosylase [Agathobacter sp.]|nr:A/G-specific adenine glycosylase [Agathobacter sp.]
MIDNFDLKQLVEPLQNWFKRNARVLPWRENPTAYYVWISEIMLQQTRVEAVKPYFDRFIKELPDVKSLAECPEDKLLKLWEGLGYYNRVRNLKIAANQIIEEYDGEIPSEYDELLKLKGIGHYTAGAISSIAYGKAVPAVDGNVLRVISRVTADDSDIMRQSVRNHMEECLYKIMNNVQEVNPSVFNQALMELGATVCLPNGAPRCEVCPWGDICEARKQNRIAELPVKQKAKKRRIEEKTVLIVKDGEKLALHKRPAKGLLAGLYELPNVEGYLTENEIIDYIKGEGYQPIRIQPICDAKHIFSHVEWHMKGYVVFLQAQGYEKDANQVDTNNAEETQHEDWLFVDVEETKEKYAIPSAFVKYTEYLNLVIGKDAIVSSDKV